jgi:hypothetical protein
MEIPQSAASLFGRLYYHAAIVNVVGKICKTSEGDCCLLVIVRWMAADCDIRGTITNRQQSPSEVLQIFPTTLTMAAW